MRGHEPLPEQGQGARTFPTASPASALMATILIVTTLIPFGNVKAATDVTATISLPGEAQTLEGSAPILILGIWNDVTVSAEQSLSNVTVVLHSGEVYPSNGTEKNFYRFSWKASTFSDELYGTWLDKASSVASGGAYKFRICINGSAMTGAWTLRVNTSGVQTYTTKFKANPTDVNFGLSSPGFLIRVDPRTPGRYYPTGVGYFRPENTGNIPLSLSLSFNKLGDWLHATNISTIRAGKELYCYVYVDAPSWDIGETFVSGTLVGTPLYRGPKEVVGLDPAYVLSFSIQIQVGRGGLELKDSGLFQLQYPTILTGEYDKSLKYDFYLSGSTEVEVTLETEKASIKSIIMDGETVKSPFKVSLVKGTEVHFTIQVKPTVDDTTARVKYRIVTTNGSIIKDYATDITVPPYNKPPEDPNDVESNRSLALAFIVITIAVTGTAAYAIYEKSRRRRALERRKARKGRAKR